MTLAIRYPITLSTTEPNNNIGLLKIRQADEETQTLVVEILEHGVPLSYEDLQVFFCAKIGQTEGLGIIEQKLLDSEMTDPKNGKLEYTMRAQDWQILGRQLAYFSFRKMTDDHTYVQQFTTRDFTYEVTKNVFSDGTRQIISDGSTYIWTIEDLKRLYEEYIASGKSDWEEFVEQNKEIIESVDPGGVVLSELIRSRKPADAETPYPDLPTRLDQQIGLSSEFRSFEGDKSFVLRTHNEFLERGANPYWFGAKGDGITDDYQALQVWLDFAFENRLHSVVLPKGRFAFSKPLILKTRVEDNNHWWFGQGINIRGTHMHESRLIKTGNDTLVSDSPNINGVDSALILHTQERENTLSPGTQSTGIQLSNLWIENQSTNSESMLVTGEACERMNIEHINGTNLSGRGLIFDICYSNTFRNIVIRCKKNAININNGTSNTFGFIYAPSCQDPYNIHCAYSTLDTVCCDKGTGTIFNIGGRGMVANIGTESPKAKHIVQTDLFGVNITSLSMHRQQGDTGLDIDDTYVIRANGPTIIEQLHILETATLPSGKTGYLIDNTGSSTENSVKLGIVKYTQQGFSNANMKYSKSKTTSPIPSSRIDQNGQSVSMRRNQFMPFIGTRTALSDLGIAAPDKAIYFDSAGPRTLGDGTSTQNELAYNIGDLLLLNDPKNFNALGYVVTEKNGQFVGNNEFATIPIVSAGSTTNRPTSNLYAGQQYFDTTLGKPIWCRYPTSKVWVDASGTTV